MTLAKLIKSSREKLGISQDDLAKNLGWKNGQFVSNIERGLANPPDDTLYALCRILKINKKAVIKACVKQRLNEVMEALK